MHLIKLDPVSLTTRLVAAATLAVLTLLGALWVFA